VRLLLDTHVFLWAVAGSRSLGADARRAIEAAEAVYVSAASIWEIAIKHALGRIDADPARLTTAIEDSGFVELPVRATHTAMVARLDKHHNDPFDRMLVAQALAEPLRLLTADQTLARYSELVIVL
jgi:PIN domain nuclease of toxin-antitoxin system